MVRIHRLLTYDYPSIESAVTGLENRYVIGRREWKGLGHNNNTISITEKFYVSGYGAEEVLRRLLPQSEIGEPPEEING